MPKKTTGAKRASARRSTAKRATAKRSTAASAKPKTSAADTKAAAAQAEAKREAREAQNAEQTAAVVKRVLKGDEKLAAVAKDLKITPGKAAFLLMQYRVAQGEVPAITGKSDETLLKNINAARLKADEHSSWGWLAARSGKSEGWIKSGLEAAKLYKPKAENIATARAAKNPKKPAPKGTTASGKKRVRGNA